MIWEKICKLIDIKSLMTLALTGTFVYLALKESIEPNEFLNVFLIVIGFYFGTQYEKHMKGV